MTNRLNDKTLTELSSLIEKREISCRELTENCLAQIRSVDNQIHAFITVCEDNALRAAENSDIRRAKGEALSVIDGIPFSAKDNICTKGVRTTCASRMLKNFVPPYTATVCKRLTGNGAILLGKTNLDEFGMGNSTENSAFFATKNPTDLSRVPGGSSGGAAASVASGEAVFALGSDTGGSVRQPAAYCGITGLCPTYGALSRFGLTAFASSLDRIGPMAKSAEDLRLLLPFLIGRDPSDSTSVLWQKPRINAPTEPKNTVIGIADEYFGNGISDEVRTLVFGALQKFISLGYKVKKVEFPSFKYALPAYYIISSAEASSNLARYDGVRFGHRTARDTNSIDELFSASRSEGFGEEVRRRIILGTFVLSAGYGEDYYKKALNAKALICKDFEAVFEKCDMLISPVSPCTAPKLGAELSPLEAYLSDIYTVPSSLAGLPALSLPCGVTREGLSVGMQLTGRRFSEFLLLDTAVRFEKS